MQLDNKINKTIETAIKNIQEIVDVNTIIGKPIETSTGKMVIPVTKITLAFLSGGGEYGKLTLFKKSEDLPFSAGNGTIVSIKPCGFLVDNIEGFNLLKIEENTADNILNNILDLINKIKAN